MRSTTITVLALWLWSVPARADSRYDVGLLLGSTHATDEGAVLVFDPARTYQATFNARFWKSDAVALSFEVAFIASPAFLVTTANPQLPKEYASLYLTPGLRVTVLPDHPVAFFAAVGGGYARYSESKVRRDESPNPQQRDTDTGALQFGGGVEVRGFKWLGFRGEIRDVFTGARNFSIATPQPRVHNVVGSGGLVIRF
ncbi:MAG: hypothetical protein HY047_10275 [Acidobacteria bacterium]|nr:hypothetical protein [Acidobacteriota bacterium]